MNHRTTFATTCRTRSASSPALTITGDRCHLAATVADACSCGHGAMDYLGPSQAALRVCEGPWMLVPPLATAAGDPLAGATSPASLPCSADRNKKKTGVFLCVSLSVYMTSGPG
jgi:hypothetical protein